MTRKMLIGAIIALGTLFFAGAAVAEDDYPTFIQGNLFATQSEAIQDVTSNVAPQDNNTPAGIEKVNPLFCTDELVEENMHVAQNTCTDNDLLLKGG